MKNTYVWDEVKIREKLSELNEKSKCNNLSTYEKNIIDMSKCSYDDVISVLTDQKRKINSIYNINSFLTFYDDMISIRRSLLMGQNMINIISYLSAIALRNIKPSQKVDEIPTDDNIINTSKKFYRKLDIDLYGIITDAEEKNDNLYHFSSMKDDQHVIGQAFYDLYNDLKYIYIAKDNTISECFTLVHEYGHILDYSSKFKCYSNIKSITTEITSQLMEMLFANSCYEDICLKKEAHKVMQHNFNVTIKTARVLMLQLKLFNIMKNMDIYYEDNYAQIYSQFSPKELKSILDDDNQYRSNVNYVFSYVIASMLFYQYQHNKKGTLSKIKYMISNGYSMSPIDLFDDIGIDLCDIGSKVKDTKILIP
jgi:Zn-dependent peptidase ImmA (M78 family)